MFSSLLVFVDKVCRYMCVYIYIYMANTSVGGRMNVKNDIFPNLKWPK